MDNRIGWEMVAEKDAGEPFMNRYHKGYDYYSGYMELKDMNRLKTFIAGDYKVSFGQRLVVSHDFNMGKNNLLVQPDRKRNGFRHHYSTNETDFLRGGAATLQAGKAVINLFISHKKLDGNIKNEKEITSFKTDGLHRTPGEQDKKGVIPFTVYGENINYRNNYAGIGVTFLSYFFHHFNVNPVEKTYNIHHFRGNVNQNYSVDYLLKNNYMKFFGETAFPQWSYGYTEWNSAFTYLLFICCVSLQVL
ncbi:MAG: hypothetical protein LUD02_10680 [Tannerellaceae bacterium]|nr:hypothetical protein [Tannerellaceae bacterium]